MNTRQISAIQRLLDEQAELASAISEMEDRLKTVKEKILIYLEDNAHETLTVGEEGNTTKVTIVRPKSLVIDEEALIAELSASQVKLVTKKVLDKKALEDAIVRGKIDESVLTSNSKEVPNKPYLKITR